MKRKAILIGCDSKTDEVKLPVSNDVEFIKSYLQSREDGYWLNSEIVVLINPSSKQLLSCFKEVKEDFRFVYYTGHGLMSRGEQYINFGEDELINISEFLYKCKKEVFIFDCCRIVYEYKFITSQYRITEANQKADKVKIRKK